MQVLFFAQLRDATGCSSAEVSVKGPVGADELWEALLERFPDLADHRPTVRFARNAEYVGPDARFDDDDEVALIPPVSGG